MYVVHLNYGTIRGGMRDRLIHLVRCPSGEGKLFSGEELRSFLVGKQWRYAK